MYHYVGTRHNLPNFRSCSESEFISQIEKLKSLDYTVCSLKDYLDFNKYKKAIDEVSLESELVKEFGSQSIILSVEAKKYHHLNGKYIPTLEEIELD